MHLEIKPLHSSKQAHDHSHGKVQFHEIHERKTKWVVLLSTLTMVAEIVVGYLSHSMALLADGWHMSSHVLALGLTWMAYRAIRFLNANKKGQVNQNKVLSLSGYSSAVILAVVGGMVLIESVERMINPEEVIYNDAVLVAVLGLLVNGLSAYILHHDHHHGDHNIRAAYLHVLADTLTSFLAIAALLLGQAFRLPWMDALAGMIGSLVVLNWSISLLKASAMDLLDIKKEESLL